MCFIICVFVYAILLSFYETFLFKMNTNSFDAQTVEKLVKSSKQLRYKIKKELNLLATDPPVFAECKHQELLQQLSPVSTSIVLMPEAQVGIQSLHTSCLSLKSNKIKPLSTTHQVKKRQPLLRNVLKEVEMRESLSFLPRSSTCVGFDIAKNKTTTNLGNSHQLNTLVSTSSYRLPLQRFAESANKTIDFFKEHPNLELDTTEHTTLFPRRFYRPTECHSLNEVECINVVGAEVKPSKKSLEAVNSETWNGILKQNKPGERHRIVRSKKINQTSLETKYKCNEIATKTHIKSTENDYDIISSVPLNGAFMIQKHSEQLDKQNNLHLQRLPVLYIRPEWTVQKVASISIHGETGNVSSAPIKVNARTNVKYYEYKHENGQQVLQDGVEMNKTKLDNRNESYPIKENKFYKALEFNDLDCNECSSTNNNSSSFTLASLSSNSSVRSSLSLSKLNSSPTVNEIKLCLQSNSPSLLSTKITKNKVKSPSVCEVYVQTENEHKDSFSIQISPLRRPGKSFPRPEVTTSRKATSSFDESVHLSKSEISSEEGIDFSKMFEKIRNDLPDALKVYKNRQISATVSIPEKCFNEEQEKQKLQNSTSHGKVLPKKIEHKSENHSQTISPLETIGSCNNSFPSILSPHKEPSLQQSPLLEPTKKSIEPISIHDKGVVRKNEEKPEYLSSVEINRAVKIFIDSLALDHLSGDKKAIITDISQKNRCTSFNTPKFISSNRLNQFATSDSSIVPKTEMNTKTVRKRTVRWSDISSPSSTGPSSTDLDSESDVTNGLQSISSHTYDTDNVSEGEVKSIGEL